MSVSLPSEPSLPSPRSSRLRRVGLGLLGAGVLIAGALGYVLLSDQHDQAALELLDAPDPELRLQGATLAARERSPRLMARIADLLETQRETATVVRQEYVYALGQSGTAAYFPLVARAAANDSDPHVRHTAWVAAARLDAARFRTLAASTRAGDDPWDQIGLGRAWLEVGDPRGVEALLHWAASGSPAERQAASLALYRGLAPLLDMIGRWPIQFEVREGDAWSPELVDKVQRRYTGLPLQAMANDLLRHVPRATAVRRNVERLNGARDWIARVLFISQRGQ